MVADYSLHTACMNGETTTVQQILSENPRAVMVKDDDSRYPLHWAVSFQHDSIVELLLSYMKKVDLDTVVDDSGWSPVHIASSTGSATILQKLLDHTIEPNVDAQTSNGITALHLACSKKHLSVVQLLIDRGASVRIKDKLDQLPLHRAAASGSTGIVSILCDQKSPVNTKDKNGWLPLFHALAEGRGDVAVTLVNKYHASWEGQSDDNDLTIDKVCADEKVKQYFLSKADR
ncbi:unnamed protein product [Kluyveromyces dobzhanskii CBS 2104]|uniref:WGS project CCBQ000000000 data, contig 00046 n=1 Tax=Kluyveromyces dobzhanskii CBS 2104 TaxID=1427455 RepID=A0A0A8L6Y2_9SACH|nr:unnamed protein product [Kluyveromyces dobzhanskii CBS 2104]